VKRGLEPGGRGIATAEAVTRKRVVNRLRTLDWTVCSSEPSVEIVIVL
jgi:hypothetical protein